MESLLTEVRKSVILVCSIILVSCASSSDKIATSYVSPTQYSSYSCNQLSQELTRLNRRKSDLAGNLDEAASNDAGLTAVSILLFWPAAFALGGNDAQEAEYARLKGEYDAVQQVAVEKNCKFNTSTQLQTAKIANQTTFGSNISAIDYYGQAEEEVNTKTYDKNIWAKALVDAEGDEAKRKVKYIVLRANQLYSEKVGSISDSSQYEQPALSDDVTGTYTSTIKGNIGAKNIVGRNPEVKLIQKGKKVSGTYGSTRGTIWGEIWGEIEDGSIKFKYEMSWGGFGSGEWTVEPDSREIIGKWSDRDGGGKWNLTRIE